MSARKRSQPTAAETGGEPYPKIKAPEFDTCNFLVENVSPEFDTKSLTTTRLFHQRGQDPISVRRILSEQELSTSRRVWRTESQTYYPHGSERGGYGRMSTANMRGHVW